MLDACQLLVTYLFGTIVVVHRAIRIGHAVIVVVMLERIVGTQQVLRLHFAAQASNVSGAEVTAQLLHLQQSTHNICGLVWISRIIYPYPGISSQLAISTHKCRQSNARDGKEEALTLAIG